MKKGLHKTLCNFMICVSGFASLKSTHLLFLVSIISLSTVFGQNPVQPPAKDIIKLQSEMLVSLHDSVFDIKNDLVNGRVYYPSGNNFVHPYFGDNLWSPATINSGGEIYDMDQVKYDINLDYLVLLHKTDSMSYPVYLNRDFVKEFSIYGHPFKYIDALTGEADELIPGYYEIDYNGKSRLMIRRVKQKVFDSSSLSETYSDRIYFFINKDSKYFRLVRQNSLIKILNDHRQEIKTFMRNNNIRLSQDNFYQAGKVLKYYDTL